MKNDYSEIKNKINREYIRDFVEIGLKSRKVSKRRLGADSFGRLKVIFNEIAPDKDFKELTRKEADQIVVRMVERYSKYWSVRSYIQIMRQFIRYLFELESDDSLPQNFKGFKVPHQKNYRNIYRDESRIVTPEEMFKNIETKQISSRDAAAVMVIFDLGLRPHEYLKARKKDIRVDELQHYTLRISDETKTGSREPILLFSIPYLTKYIKHLSDDDFLFDKSHQTLFKAIKRVTDNKCSPYDLRASSMSYFGMYLTDQEMKARYGSNEFKHYVRLSKKKEADKMDVLTGRTINGEGLKEDIKKISPKFCISCNYFSNYNEERCSTCGKMFDIGEELKKKIYDEIAYNSYFELKKIDIKVLDKIALSVAKKYGAAIEKTPVNS